MIATEPFEWKARVLASGPCIAHPGKYECEGEVRAHHVITQQALRKHGWIDFRWETDNGVPVCERGHRRHHSGLERIPRDRLPRRAIDFANAIGLGWMILRYYP